VTTQRGTSKLAASQLFLKETATHERQNLLDLLKLQTKSDLVFAVENLYRALVGSALAPIFWPENLADFTLN
jgi:hypothetical protein